MLIIYIQRNIRKGLNMDIMRLTEKEKTAESIAMGQKAYFSKTITEGDVALFAGITGDFAPLSMNREFAEKTPFLDRLVQTMLLATYTWPVTTMIASPGAVTIAQNSIFLKPVKIGDTIRVVGEVTEKHMDHKVVIIRTTCFNQDGEMVLDGSAVELMRVHDKKEQP